MFRIKPTTKTAELKKVIKPEIERVENIYFTSIKNSIPKYMKGKMFCACPKLNSICTIKKIKCINKIFYHNIIKNTNTKNI